MSAKRPSFWKAHGPIAIIIGSVFVFILCDCVGTPTNDTGPSGSDSMCLGFLLFNGIIWVPLAIWLFWQQRKESFYERFDWYPRPILYGIPFLVLLLAFSRLRDEGLGGVQKEDFPLVTFVTLSLNLMAGKLVHLCFKIQEPEAPRNGEVQQQDKAEGIHDDAL